VDKMKTAEDIVVGWNWKEHSGNDDEYLFGTVVVRYNYDAKRPEQFYVVIIIRLATSHIICRGFWSTDVVEQFYDGINDAITTNENA